MSGPPIIAAVCWTFARNPEERRRLMGLRAMVTQP